MIIFFRRLSNYKLSNTSNVSMQRNVKSNPKNNTNTNWTSREKSHFFQLNRWFRESSIQIYSEFNPNIFRVHLQYGSQKYSKNFIMRRADLLVFNSKIIIGQTRQTNGSKTHENMKIAWLTRFPVYLLTRIHTSRERTGRKVRRKKRRGGASAGAAMCVQLSDGEDGGKRENDGRKETGRDQERPREEDWGKLKESPRRPEYRSHT